jgi:hypothetical protein
VVRCGDVVYRDHKLVRSSLILNLNTITYPNIINLQSQSQSPISNLQSPITLTPYQITLTRRDDIESLLFVLLYFLKGGKLPWMGLGRGLGQDDGERHRKVLECKQVCCYC